MHEKRKECLDTKLYTWDKNTERERVEEMDYVGHGATVTKFADAKPL